MISKTLVNIVKSLCFILYFVYQYCTVLCGPCLPLTTGPALGVNPVCAEMSAREHVSSCFNLSLLQSAMMFVLSLLQSEMLSLLQSEGNDVFGLHREG